MPIKNINQKHHPIFSKFPCFEAMDLPGHNNILFKWYEYFEWIDLLESIDHANRQFIMLEIGAGLGCWGARGAFAAQSREIAYWL